MTRKFVVDGSGLIYGVKRAREILKTHIYVEEVTGYDMRKYRVKENYCYYYRVPNFCRKFYKGEL